MHRGVSSRLRRLALACLPILLCAPSFGCADPPAAETQVLSVSAFTVENGDRFVVSATPERIVPLFDPRCAIAWAPSRRAVINDSISEPDKFGFRLPIEMAITLMNLSTSAGSWLLR